MMLPENVKPLHGAPDAPGGPLGFDVLLEELRRLEIRLQRYGGRVRLRPASRLTPLVQDGARRWRDRLWIYVRAAEHLRRCYGEGELRRFEDWPPETAYYAAWWWWLGDTRPALLEPHVKAGIELADGVRVGLDFLRNLNAAIATGPDYTEPHERALVCSALRRLYAVFGPAIESEAIAEREAAA